MTIPLPNRIFILTAVFSLCFLTASGFTQVQVQPAGLAPPSLHWETNIDAAFARAELEQRPLFLHFVGNDCLPARQMASEVFTQPNIAAHLNTHFVMVRINATENAALAQKFSVTAIPTDLIIKPNRQLVHRRTGGITAERFAEYLAFLQKTLQPETIQQAASVVPTANPVVTAQNPAAQPAVSPQRDTITIPDTIRDPFMPQQAAAIPINVKAASPSSANPLQTIEATTKPASPVNHSVSPQAPITVPAAASTTPLIASNEPAPPKTIVEVPLALEGFCPVTLCTEERWITGNPAYCAMYQGHLFRFASPNALGIFARNPAKYIPIAMGEDVVLMVERNKRVNGDRKFGAWFQERVFLFSSQESLNTFAARPEYYTEIALKYELARKEQPTPIVY